MKLEDLRQPLAITMWDFSWLERRWEGAGYEDWDRALDELSERGYDAVRIDAYPHLLAEDPKGTWDIQRLWSIHDWGSPKSCKVQVQPALNQFIECCAKRDIKVALSSWFREDKDNVRMKIDSAQKHGAIWVETLRQIEKAGLLENILFVDLCNEWPGDYWARFFVNEPPELTWKSWHTDKSMQWMRESISVVRKAYPQLDYCFSIDNTKHSLEKDCSFMDLLEPHIWMAFSNGQEYYNEVGYGFDLHDISEYDTLVAKAEKVYRARPEYWESLLKADVQCAAQWSIQSNQPLVTTECWGIVDYKDYPGLSWDWVKRLCEVGVQEAASTGRWSAISTNNFCGPQFVELWRDIAWHRKMTDIIKSANLPKLK